MEHAVYSGFFLPTFVRSTGSVRRLPGVSPALLACTLALAACNGGSQTTESTTGDTETSTDPTGPPIPYACSQYVDCYSAATPNKADEVAGEYGANGSCWSLDAAGQEQCVDDCEDGLLQYHMYFPELAECALPETDVTFQIGEAVFEDVFLDEAAYSPRQDGDTLTMLLGGQGLTMFALAMRGENFVTAEDRFDWDNPMMPTINMWMDIEGYNIGVGGHFARIYNYPVYFEELGDGTLEHVYVAVIVPDELPDELEALDGLPGHVWMELHTFENPPVTRELDFVVHVDLDAGMNGTGGTGGTGGTSTGGTDGTGGTTGCDSSEPGTSADPSGCG